MFQGTFEYPQMAEYISIIIHATHIILLAEQRAVSAGDSVGQRMVISFTFHSIYGLFANNEQEIVIKLYFSTWSCVMQTTITVAKAKKRIGRWPLGCARNENHPMGVTSSSTQMSTQWIYLQQTLMKCVKVNKFEMQQ